MLKLAACLKQLFPEDSNLAANYLQFAEALSDVDDRGLRCIAGFLASHNAKSQPR